MKKHPLIIAASIFFLAFILSRVDRRPESESSKIQPAVETVSPVIGEAKPAFSASLVEVQAERNLEKALRDPGSKQIRGEYVSTIEGSPLLCGEVNSRNGFGGMTGFKRFVASPLETAPVAIEGENITTEEFDNFWRLACSRRM